MPPHFHEDAPRVCAEPRVDALKPQSSVSSTRVPTDRILSLLGNIRTFGTDLGGADEVSSVPRCLRHSGLLLLGQRELDAFAFQAVQESGVRHPILQAGDQDCLLVEALDEVCQGFLRPLFNLGQVDARSPPYSW